MAITHGAIIKKRRSVRSVLDKRCCELAEMRTARDVVICAAHECRMDSDTRADVEHQIFSVLKGSKLLRPEWGVQWYEQTFTRCDRQSYPYLFRALEVAGLLGGLRHDWFKQKTRAIIQADKAEDEYKYPDDADLDYTESALVDVLEAAGLLNDEVPSDWYRDAFKCNDERLTWVLESAGLV